MKNAIILNGRKIADQIKNELANDVLNLKLNNIVPGLAVILVGDDEASKLYVNSKEKMSSELGINSVIKRLPETCSQAELQDCIKQFNQNRNIHGILVQLPLPKHINPDDIMQSIEINKDVDCFHPYNYGKLLAGVPKIKSCTPAGIIELLKRYNVRISGEHCVIVGRSNIVGKPLASLMILENATVTICHSYTQNIEFICRQADILVSAVGQKNFVNSNFVKQGATVIDVGINRLNDTVTGDVNFKDVSQIVKYITPVPGGIGPMTIIMLMKNVIDSASRISIHD